MLDQRLSWRAHCRRYERQAGRPDAHRSASRTGRSVRRHAQARRPTLHENSALPHAHDYAEQRIRMHRGWGRQLNLAPDCLTRGLSRGDIGAAGRPPGWRCPAARARRPPSTARIWDAEFRSGTFHFTQSIEACRELCVQCSRYGASSNRRHVEVHLVRTGRSGAFAVAAARCRRWQAGDRRPRPGKARLAWPAATCRAENWISG